jgi:PelA/Pel-15E family pectate lyase
MRSALRFLVTCAPLLAACGDNQLGMPPTGGTTGGGGAGGMGTPVDGSATEVGVDAGTWPGCPASPATRPAATPSWSSISGLKNAQSWYTTAPAAYVADNILYYQNSNGGWPKNIDMSLRYGIDTGAAMRDGKSMIDNNATTTQIRFLAFALGSYPDCQKYADGFNKGLEYLFKAQYPSNGGWPQVYPVEPTDYSRRITYNDNAMVHVLQIMRDIVYGAPLFKFVNAAAVEKATTALNKGVDCILKTQIVVDGKKTGWCAQHDEVTLAPANARSYELASESGKEGAQVMAFLMTLDLSRPDVPRDDIVAAVDGAVLFHEQVKITGYKYVQGASDAGAEDSWIEADPNADPIWARFYELTPPFRPFFCDRDGIKKYSLAEIGVERRGGYSWYGRDPATPLAMTYPAWVAQWNIGHNVLGGSADGGGAEDAGAVDADTPDAGVD